MKRYKKNLVIVLMTLSVSLLISHPVFAISESEVQAQVDAVGKEAVSGNVFIWFLCAIAFLKVSQKIDSFMSSLGINVGHTGGSMMAEAMIAARGIGSAKNFASHSFRGGRGGNTSISKSGDAGAGGFLSGGLAGVVSRNTVESARKSATGGTASGSTAGYSGGIGGRMYASSVSRGGDFANNVISTVATGGMGMETGTMTGEKAAEALHSYLGYAALEEGAANVPQFSNVEIGGGRITGTETSEEYPGGVSFGMYHTGQYAQPEGNYSTVQTKDGASWYKQYAADKVEKSPYMAPDGSIAYKESIVKKLPQPPHRKDRM